MILVMTPYQKDVFAKYVIDRICVDTIHGTTSHDFRLTTLLTVDEFGAGCRSVAFSGHVYIFLVFKRKSRFNINQSTDV